MNSQEAEIIQSEPRTYQEWIDLGDALMSSNVMEAQICFKKALQLSEDKYEAYLRLGSIKLEYKLSPIATLNLVSALEYANNQKDRLQSIANELEKVHARRIAKYVHGLIRMIDPNYDHEIPKNYDYYYIVSDFIQIGKANYAKGLIEKLIELSENKSDILIAIGKNAGQLKFRDYGSGFESADQYFQRSLDLADDKFDLLLRIGDIYFSNYPDLSIKYFEYAKLQRPDSLKPHLRIFKRKLQLQLFQEVLQQIKKLQIPDDEQSYLDLGVLLALKDETYNDGLEYILKGLELSQNKYQTISNLLKLHELQDNGNKLLKLLYEKALDININDFDIWRSYANYLQNWYKISDETLDVFDKGIIANPDQAMLYFYKAQLLKKEGRNNEVIDNYKKGIQISPIDAYIDQELTTLIQLLFEKKQLDSLKYYNRLDQKDGYILFLSQALFQSGYYEECIKMCDQSLQSEHNQFPHYVLEQKAKALFELKRYDKALPLLDIATMPGWRAEDIYQQIQKIKQGQQDKDQKVEEQ